ncbi:TRAP transporter large permease subunit [Alkalimarinus sediminis]|uniref:TRAP transporter large permease subunit n=1 Tax=Alkalimarinus sediminis TaxID=1632866 RepID=A0A9E8HHT7_9ALTE|nr:TRAP transporter large permease subunit [Alkalimarinus sediminis]UZW74575.1 TRAP transporter large permease subunit [Alkalimarinus sediminis]
MEKRGFANRSAREWISSFPACILLLAVVIFSTGSDIHNQMLKMGEQLWGGYYKLRIDPQQPTCDATFDVEQRVQEQLLADQSSSDDDMDLFEDEPVDPAILRSSLENAKSDCAAKYVEYEVLKDRISPGVKAFRAVELFVSDLVAFGLTSQRFILALLVLLCAATATMTRHHIAMRAMQTQLDHTVSFTLQFIANGMLLVSTLSFRALSHSGGAEIELSKEILHDLWIAGFGLLTIISAIKLFRIPADAKPGGNLTHALLSVPLYTTMCLIAGTYFAIEGHVAGIGIYLDKMMDLSDMFLNVGLYVWVGMMLKETRLATLVFNVFKPWKMPPEMLAVVAVIAAAIPTAYTGASGIFVIAAGAVIYHELRSAGARRQLALAATAMSGSLGVVLRPCLLVVVIAYLNREVTTDDLFGWGIWVFLLTAGMFMVVSMSVNRQSKLELAPAGEAFPAMIKEFKHLVPYILVIAGIVLFYRFALDVKMDEFSAPRVLPVMLLAILIYEHITLKGGKKNVSGEINHQGLERSIRSATNETTSEIGALLLLIGCSVSIGGVIERSGMMEMFPHSFDSAWSAMVLLVIVLVILGMIMDAFGAVILVSATIATIAYQSGIHPVHFWMVTLVAFELGYLSPPVALNHLLTRQVVGQEEVELALQEGGTFYQRHERIIMPLIVMGISLLLVAFVPLAIGY